MLALVFPPLDPVAINIGPLAIRWYALAYLAGFVLGWRYCLYLAKQNAKGPSAQLFDDFLTWAVVGTVVGGRLGYILFYQADYYFAHPMEMLQVWHGGMSFHGGMMGVIGAAWLFTRRHKIPFFSFTDILACVTPIGLGLGRVANFINGELFGRATDEPWGMVFPRGGDMPRHPSQLYEAVLEGIVLFLILFFLARNPKIRGRTGLLSGVFLFGYSTFRFIVEHFREPDQQLGFLAGGLTMGQWLCLPMMLFGFYIILWSERRVKRRTA
ncbi:MAG TPA: prolipoprotein diacylglyceryl transferase [Alphaproteobacteria bacterium]|nr:prolipoprotein diacylglyceryl transferase [Alphaproteobacteria bacterium]